jgi:hypothetical protein
VCFSGVVRQKVKDVVRFEGLTSLTRVAMLKIFRGKYNRFPYWESDGKEGEMYHE